LIRLDLYRLQIFCFFGQLSFYLFGRQAKSAAFNHSADHFIL